MTSQMSSREFNQDTSRAKKAAEQGPVYITDRGRPAHVLMTIETYEALIGSRSVVEVLGEPAGVGNVDLPLSISDERAAPAVFD